MESLTCHPDYGLRYIIKHLPQDLTNNSTHYSMLLLYPVSLSFGPCMFYFAGYSLPIKVFFPCILISEWFFPRLSLQHSPTLAGFA